MTRASLLHILDNLGGISETEVQELEQLAATFPYCQTAHLLLAKAAHDRGSMLAAQRLRRAATYAVDRQQLRALIELPAPLPPVEAFVPATVAPVDTESRAHLPTTVHPTHDDNTPDELELLQAAVTTDTDNTELQPIDNQLLANTLTPEESDSKEESSAFIVIREERVATAILTSEAVLLDNTVATSSHATIEEQPEVAQSQYGEVANEFSEQTSEPATEVDALLEKEFVETSTEVNVVASEMESPAPEETELSVEEPLGELADLKVETADLPVTNASEAEPETELTEEELPLLPPPIRPPAEVGISRFEFGLTQTLPVPTYNLFEVEKAAAKQIVAIPPFWSDEEVGYAPGLGSRLGFCLQAHDEYSLDLPPSAFFEPDALLLQHLKQHQPVPPPVPTSIDLIDKFLRSKPRFRAPLPLPPTTEAQADLSVRSTLAEPSLASESLARILARQGKIGKAIEIYERLMVRQPEKKAYFADQIQQLQTFE
ncbi:hypothetical protein [Hymenobacter sp. HDW8]|uniref:hypothetical protein n=1 Tax=Hymenobacter sp. HDW8 TaxID=2714932 RepID=UPI001407B3F9|nr:hypothetical protein [Hymenobacter sp. HDW8]QIL75018.1 hypothetical protein G7064_03480 [Hymenobacter sp. HDW8]